MLIFAHEKVSIYQILSIIILLVAVGLQYNKAFVFKDTLSSAADEFTEADVIRAGESYVDRGFLYDYGVPFIRYGDKFLDFGTPRTKKKGSEVPYLHFPSGPYMTTGLQTLVCGKGNLGCFRVLSVSFSFFTSIVFLFSLFFLFKGPKLLFATIFLVGSPVFANTMHGLNHQGYSIALVVLQISVLLRWFKEGIWNLKKYIILFLITFLHGQFSLDTVFIVSFCSIPVYFIFNHFSYNKVKSELLPIVLISGIGLSSSYFLHFGQVIGHYGGIEKTYNDFKHVFEQRSNNKGKQARKTISSEKLRLSNLLHMYLNDAPKRKIYFRFSFYYLLIVAFAFGVFLYYRKVKINGYILSVTSSLLISLLWVITMRQHSYIHLGFIPRQLYLFYCISIINILYLMPSIKTYRKIY